MALSYNFEMEQTQKFTLGFYFQYLTMMLKKPGRFFADLPPDVGVKRPLGFLVSSSLFYATAGIVSRMASKPIILGGIFFLNAVGMAFIAAGLGYLVMVMTMGKRVTFTRFFSIYAFSSGITLLAAWVPFFIWLTEPWKWWLIGTGMVHGFGFKWSHALVIIIISVSIIILFFYSVVPLVLPI